MPLNTNAWNRLRYTFWAPLYDLVGRRFDPYRRRSLALLELTAGERVLLVGAGTGADLPYLPEGLRVLATDLTPAMLARARSRLRPGVELAVMDAQALDLPEGAFDAVVLHLILAVVPDPARCLAEAARVLRPGGRIAVLDKFLADGQRASLRRRLANLFASALFTDLTRQMGEILARSRAPLQVERDEPAFWGGVFRYILLRKIAA